MATLASFPAREVVVSTLGTIYNLGDEASEESLGERLQGETLEDGKKVFTIPVALSIMVFFALCCQCGATVATIKRETNSWSWAWFTFTYMTVLAYIGGTNSFKNSEVRRILTPLAEIARRRKIAVLAVNHLNKGSGGRAMYRPSDSLAFIAAARSGPSTPTFPFTSTPWPCR